MTSSSFFAQPPVPTGLNGDYSGTCLACMRPTDTAVAVDAPRELQLTFLQLLGIDDLVAQYVLQDTEAGESEHGDGAEVRVYQLCRECAVKAPGPVKEPQLVIADGQLPVIVLRDPQP